LPARAPRGGSGGRGHRRPAIGGVGRSREPAARAEGADRVPAAGPYRGQVTHHQAPFSLIVGPETGRLTINPLPSLITGTPMSDITKVVLAYSGGLDTSDILK